MKLLLALPFLLIACPSTDKPDPVADPTDRTTSTTPDKPETKAPEAPETPPGPAALYTPTTDVPPTSINFPGGSCPKLPKPDAKANEDAKRTAQLAAALRRAACEPQLYAMPANDLSAELDLPSGVTVSFNSPGGLTFAIEPAPSTKDLAAALGIKKPVARLRWNAYHDSWWLGSNPDNGELDLYSPGVINIGLSHEADRDDPQGKVVAFQESMAMGASIWVGMPDGVVTMGPDGEGMKQLTSAMSVLAGDPAMLDKEPEDVAKLLQLEGERWRVARTSLHSEGNVINGISIQPMRTLIPADALADALGIEDAKAENVNREHDVWNMSGGAKGSTQLSWKGISIEIDVTPADGSNRTTTLAGATADFISIRP
jgi:hypothetical protein